MLLSRLVVPRLPRQPPPGRLWRSLATTTTTTTTDIPVVDFGRIADPDHAGPSSSPAWGAVVGEVREVFSSSLARDDGLACFHADLGSLVPSASVDRGYANLRAFHSLPPDVKAKYHSGRSRINRGWVPLFEEPAYEEKVSFVEAFDLGGEVAEEDAAGSPGIGPNVWPDEAEIPTFREDVSRLYDELTDASAVLFKVFAAALGLDDLTTFSRHSTERSRSVMRLLRYPPSQPTGAGEDDIGISAHTDFECFTLIHQSARGLQVQDAGGAWINLPPAAAPGGSGAESVFVVLIGDMMEVSPHAVPLPPLPPSLSLFLMPRCSLDLRFTRFLPPSSAGPTGGSKPLRTGSSVPPLRPRGSRSFDSTASTTTRS